MMHGNGKAEYKSKCKAFESAFYSITHYGTQGANDERINRYIMIY